MPVCDSRPGGADGRQLGLLGIKRLGAVHLGGDGHWRLGLAVVLGEALGLCLGHGPTLTVLEVVYLLDALGLGGLPVPRLDHDVAAVGVAAQVDLGGLLGFRALETAGADREGAHEDVGMRVAVT